MRTPLHSNSQDGASMIEVLVTLVILAAGLLGLVGLQSRLQLAEMESYQRVQAVILLEDMASRVVANRNFAAEYVTDPDTPLGHDMTCPDDVTTQQERDAHEWCNALKGASERAADESTVGAMVGARGCVEDLGSNEYRVTIAWQGLAPAAAPPASVACGIDLYNDDATGCVDNLCRRAVTTIVHIASLS